MLVACVKSGQVKNRFKPTLLTNSRAAGQEPSVKSAYTMSSVDESNDSDSEKTVEAEAAEQTAETNCIAHGPPWVVDTRF